MTTSPPGDQYEALHTGCGVVELVGWSSVTLGGADRQSFLHSFCTNDVRRLVPGDACEALFTNVKGKIVGHGVVTARDEELVIVTVPGQAARLIEHLDRYVIREDVTLSDTSAERAWWLVAGERQEEVVAQLALGALPGAAVCAFPWEIAAGRPVTLIESQPVAADVLRHVLAGLGAVVCNEETWQAARIEWGLPLYGVDFGEDNLPQELGRNAQAISFTKGCYLGQETVARIDAMGHVNRQLVGIRFAAADVPPVGTPLESDDATVGHVSSATFSPRLGAPLALAIVRHTCAAPGTPLQSPAGECEVLSLPVV